MSTWLDILFHTTNVIVILIAIQAFLATAWSNCFHPDPRQQGTHTRLLVVLGSGGHTAEMLALLRELDTYKFGHRSYVASSGDDLSLEKAKEFEQNLQAKLVRRYGDADGAEVRSLYGTFDCSTVPRARRIHQPLVTAPWSCLQCFASCVCVLWGSSFSALFREDNKLAETGRGYADWSARNLRFPDLIVVNGPATAVMVVYAAIFLRAILFPFYAYGKSSRRPKMRTIYVESWARVQSLSLSGILLKFVVDRFIVQWRHLEGHGSEYVGVLV